MFQINKLRYNFLTLRHHYPPPRATSGPRPTSIMGDKSARPRTVAGCDSLFRCIGDVNSYAVHYILLIQPVQVCCYAWSALTY